jgi:hypothetical protein
MTRSREGSREAGTQAGSSQTGKHRCGICIDRSCKLLLSTSAAAAEDRNTQCVQQSIAQHSAGKCSQQCWRKSHLVLPCQRSISLHPQDLTLLRLLVLHPPPANIKQSASLCEPDVRTCVRRHSRIICTSCSLQLSSCALDMLTCLYFVTSAE